MFWNFLTRSLWSVSMSGRCFTSRSSASWKRKREKDNWINEMVKHEKIKKSQVKDRSCKLTNIITEHFLKHAFFKTQQYIYIMICNSTRLNRPKVVSKNIVCNMSKNVKSGLAQLVIVFLLYAEISRAQAECLCHHFAQQYELGSAWRLSPCSSTQQKYGLENFVEARPGRDVDRQTRASWLDWRRCESQLGWMCSLPLAVCPIPVEERLTEENNMLHSDLSQTGRISCGLCSVLVNFTLSWGMMIVLLTSVSHPFLASLVESWLS